MHSGGDSDPDMKALAVMPRTPPSASAVITVTPVAKRPMTRRNSMESTAVCLFTHVHRPFSQCTIHYMTF